MVHLAESSLGDTPEIQGRKAGKLRTWLPSRSSVPKAKASAVAQSRVSPASRSCIGRWMQLLQFGRSANQKLRNSLLQGCTTSPLPENTKNLHTPGPDVSVWWGSLEGVDPRGGTKGPLSPDEHPPPSPPVRQGDSASLPSLFHLATSKISFSSDQLAPSLLRGFHDAGYTLPSVTGLLLISAFRLVWALLSRVAFLIYLLSSSSFTLFYFSFP